MKSTLTRTVQKAAMDRAKPDSEWQKILNPTQFKVLREGSTEKRNVSTGFSNHFEQSGQYHCAGCDRALYDAKMKFQCGCGWPAFYTCLDNAVWELPDKDGSRSEIRCTSCGGHLGHVFRNEGFKNPEPNERHCVNSVSISFRKGDEVLKCTYDGPVY